MRTILNLALVSLLGFILDGCNSPEKSKETLTEQTSDTLAEQTKSKKEAPEATDADYCTLGNFLITPEEAQGMIKHFKKVFYDELFKKGYDLADSVFVDKCVVNQFHEFLSKNSGYDGIRIYFVGTGKNSNIWIVPTLDDANHSDFWGKLPGVANCSDNKFKNYNQDEAIGKPKIDDFGRDYREEQQMGEVSSAVNDSLSRAVWFGKCMIDSLVTYLNDPVLKLDGVKIHSGAYKTKNRARGQKKDNQSTFIVVVTKGGVSDWSILSNKQKGNIRFFEGGYNHGQLCPTICD
jgi:hypothetical protein